MTNNNDIPIKDIQNKLLEMMIIFHDLCIKHDIKYYMLGGTMLGAVRHKGFIPWDDDMDIGLPRPDYEKLLALPQSEWPANIKLNTPATDGHPYPYSKLIDANTTLVEDLGKDIVQGIFIDIFPLDGAGSNKNQAIRHKKKISLLMRFLYASIFSHYKNKPIWKKIAITFIRLTRPNYWLNTIEKNLTRKDFYKNTYVGNLVGAWGDKEIVPREYFGQPTLYEFKDKQFYGVEKYDDYLTCLYGDYMKLPPIEKQKSHHLVKYINLNLPYEKYLKGEWKI
jgi:lipopolysaccharide cholinephosphotransferase